MFYTCTETLNDFGIVSIVIVISHMLRYKINLLQITFIPSSLVGGLICVLGGPQFFDIIPFSLNLDGNANIASYPKFLAIVLFASLFLGYSEKNKSFICVLKKNVDTFFLNAASLIGQYGSALFFGILVAGQFFPYLPKSFFLLLPAGFTGGHGTAAIVGGLIEENGWKNCANIGYAFATLGTFLGIFGGILLINVGVRKNWTRLVKSFDEMPISMKTGFLPQCEQTPIGKETVSPMSLDSLTWHFAIIMAVAISAFHASKLLNCFLPDFLIIPEFCLALIIGAIFQKICNFFNVGQCIDKSITQHVGSLITDYLIVFGIASIELDTIIQYAAPIFVMFLFGFFYTTCTLWFIGRKLCKNLWFERSILMYGWSTGSLATSLVLLKIIDPTMRTKIFEDFSYIYMGVTFFEVLIVVFVPNLVLKGIVLPIILLLSFAFILCLFFSYMFVGFHKGNPSSLREGENEV